MRPRESTDALRIRDPVLLALVTAGLVLVALRDPAIRSRRVLEQLPRMLGPAICLFALWRWYVSQIFPNSEQAFRPFDTWNFGVLRQTLAAIAGVIADSPLFQLDNVVLSPHMAGVTQESVMRIVGAALENIQRAARGEEPHDVVTDPLH